VDAETGRADADQAAAAIFELTGVPRHDAVVVLGSGWSPAAEAFGEPAAAFPMVDVPGFLAPVAEGHLGEIRSYDVQGVRILAYLGRTHLYEGHGLGPVVHGVRTAAACGARLAVLTNANGSLRGDWEVGQPLLVADHLNLTGTSPLEGPRFVDLTDAWSPRLRALARAADPTLVDAVYAQLRGPSVQTVAETGMLRTLGADLVGMSTVVEAIAARAAGLELLGLSAVTTLEGTGEELDPDDVVRVAEDTARRVAGVLPDVLGAVRDDLPTTNEEDLR
jgi:purine-nucleoside phosphorylase